MPHPCQGNICLLPPATVPGREGSPFVFFLPQQKIGDAFLPHRFKEARAPAGGAKKELHIVSSCYSVSFLWNHAAAPPRTAAFSLVRPLQDIRAGRDYAAPERTLTGRPRLCYGLCSSRQEVCPRKSVRLRLKGPERSCAGGPRKDAARRLFQEAPRARGEKTRKLRRNR